MRYSSRALTTAPARRSSQAVPSRFRVPTKINVNKRTVVHKKSDGVAMGFPDVCRVPAPPAPFAPVPFPNIAMSADTSKGSKKVKMDGNPIMLKGSEFSKSTGDEAGTLGGMVSNTNKGKAEFINYSFDVKVEGKNVPRLGDMMLLNKLSSPNTPPFPEVQPPSVAVTMTDEGDDNDIEAVEISE
jgi:hypothetical protein